MASTQVHKELTALFLALLGGVFFLVSILSTFVFLGGLLARGNLALLGLTGMGVGLTISYHAFAAMRRLTDPSHQSSVGKFLLAYFLGLLGVVGLLLSFCARM